VNPSQQLTSPFPRQAATYGQLLRLLPAPLVREHGDDMLALFCHHLADARGSFRAWLNVWFAAVGDIARHGPRLPRRSVGAPGPHRSPRQDLTLNERLRALVATLIRDASYGIRLLRKDWTFTVAATLILGLAIGANTAVFSFVDTYMLRPLPYPDADHLGLLTLQREGGGAGPGNDGRTWEAIRDAHSDRFQAAVYSGWRTDANLATGATASTVALQRVGAGYFSTLGVPPALGRDFTVGEDVPDGAAVAILSHALWQQIFAGDRAAIGDSLLLRGEPHTIVGVMPQEFSSSANADIWVPLRPSTSGEGSGVNYTVLLRLAPDSTWAEADAELHAIGLSLNEQISDERRRFTLSFTSLQAGDAMMLRMLLTLLSSAVVMVLVIACVNVSGLLLARGNRRGREIATRMAIGGGRAAIMRQFVVESLVLATAGGLVGLLFARGLLRAIEIMGTEVLGTWRPVSLDMRVLAGTAIISLATALIFGLAPAVQASHVTIHDALRGGGERGVAAGTRRWRKLLVIAEVGLSVVLLVAAGLLLRTFLHLQGLEPGFDPQGIVSVSVSLQDARYETRASVEQLFNAGLEQVRTLPSTISATAALGLPYDRLLNMPFKPLDFELEDGTNPITNLVYVSSDYFETLGVPILAGRTLNVSDAHDSAPVAVVNEAFAQAYLPGAGVLTHTFETAGADRQVVGVVGTVKQRGSWGAAAPVQDTPVVYVPVSQINGEFLKVVHTWFAPAWIVRAAGDPGAVVPDIERALASVDPLLPLASTRFASDLQDDAIGIQRFIAILVGVLASAAVILASLGIYGLVASTVAERRREIGIRLALGASAGHAVRVAALPSIRLAAIGAVLGIGGSLAAGRALRSMLWGVAPSDPWTYAGVTIGLVAAAAIASLVPAARAARLDPAQTLRVE